VLGRLGVLGASGALVFGSCDPACVPTARPPAATAPAPGAGFVLAAKPLQGPCTFIDTFGQARGGGRVHLGTDIGADEGRDVYAVAAGDVIKVYANEALAGNGVRMRTPDGTVIFYAHLLALVPGIAVGTTLTPGQLIGYVGQTGNAGGPHLHLEIHIGGDAVNPYPLVRAIGAC
jgi:murein DD-endopeptidase MepM/ murein hydrolase activator NlpD